MTEIEAPLSRPWSRVGEAWGVALWASFIAACAETAVVFACCDPLTLGFDDYFSASAVALRPMIYAFGFFFFWLFSFVGTALTACMLLSGRHAASREQSAGR
ncbi:MAG: hypothetical protein ABSG29_12745 [Steroidobacteraceae bacterium]